MVETSEMPVNNNVQVETQSQDPRAIVEARRDAQLDGSPMPDESVKPAPSQLTEDTVQALLAKQVEALEAKFTERFNRELGQFRKLPKELEGIKSTLTQTKQPGVYERLNPEEQQAYKELVSKIVEQEYGPKLSKYDQYIERLEKQELINERASLAQEYLGDDFKQLDGVMGSLYRKLVRDAQAGDEKAGRFLNEIDTTESGVIRLAEMARKHASEQVSSQNAKAEQGRIAAARGVAAVPSGAPGRKSTGAEEQLLAEMKSKDPEVRAKALAKTKEVLDSRAA